MRVSGTVGRGTVLSRIVSHELQSFLMSESQDFSHQAQKAKMNLFLFFGFGVIPCETYF